MKLHRLIALPLALLAGTAAIAAPAADPLAAARVRAHVEYLADDLLEGRGTGTRGHEIAAAYVVSQFRALGLQPAGEKGGWYQWVPFRRASLVPGKTSIAMTLGGKTVPVSEYDLGVRPSLTDKSRAVDAGMVFVGYGISDPALGIDDYAGLDVKGTSVGMLRGTRSTATRFRARRGTDKPASRYTRCTRFRFTAMPSRRRSRYKRR